MKKQALSLENIILDLQNTEARLAQIKKTIEETTQQKIQQNKEIELLKIDIEDFKKISDEDLKSIQKN